MSDGRSDGVFDKDVYRESDLVLDEVPGILLHGVLDAVSQGVSNRESDGEADVVSNGDIYGKVHGETE